MRAVWPRLRQRFSVRTRKSTSDPLRGSDTDGLHVLYNQRPPATILDNHPVDMLVIEHAGIRGVPRRTSSESWEHWVWGSALKHRPALMVESWPSSAVPWEHGPTGKACKVCWENLGYAWSNRSKPTAGGPAPQGQGSSLDLGRHSERWTGALHGFQQYVQFQSFMVWIH